MKRSALERRAPLVADPEKVSAFTQRGRVAAVKNTKRRPISEASPEQRRKVKGRICVNCGGGPCDPAHLTARGVGGCDDAACVLPLCRTCHRSLDEGGGIDLTPVLALPEFAAERSHMAGHMSFHACIRRLGGAT